MNSSVLQKNTLHPELMPIHMGILATRALARNHPLTVQP